MEVLRNDRWRLKRNRAAGSRVRVVLLSKIEVGGQSNIRKVCLLFYCFLCLRSFKTPV